VLGIGIRFFDYYRARASEFLGLSTLPPRDKTIR
jgi:hypothetical protein